MQKLKNGLKALGRYPIILLFFAFLFLFTLVDLLKPAKEISELENRKLTQAPAFTLSSFLNNEWTKQYGEFIRDQFLLRDGWVSMQSALEVGQGKLESGGVWFAADGYQIAKNDVLSTAQQRLLPLNTEVVGELAGRHPGQVSVMVVPSAANILADKLRWNPPQVDENGLMDAMFAEMAAAGAQVLDLRPAFAAADEAGRQLYYRTDHHWTTDGGALLAYQALCEAASRPAVLPDETGMDGGRRVEVDGFLGTNFAKTKRPGTRADTLVYYDLPGDMTIYRPQADGSISEHRTGIMDKSKLDGYDKYAAFLHGNNGYSVIEGDGEGSILVIKDSYGNCFAPYLAMSYAKVGVIDLRDWVSGVDGLIAEEGYDEILVLYSFSSFSSDTYVTRLAAEKQANHE